MRGSTTFAVNKAHAVCIAGLAFLKGCKAAPGLAETATQRGESPPGA